MWVALALGGCIAPKYIETDEREEPCVESTWFRDSDGDGVGSSGFATDSCEAPEGWVASEGDCDDSDPDNAESCPGEDCRLLSSFEPEEDTADPEEDRAYYACTTPLGWQEARQICFNVFDGDLVNMGLDGEYDSVTDAAHRMGLGEHEGWWVGLKQETTSPSIDFGWFWVGVEGWPPSGDLDSGGIWHPGEPNNGNLAENTGGAADEDVAALVFQNNTWGVIDLFAEQELPYVCEVKE